LFPIKKEPVAPMDFLIKALFPRLAPWQRRQQARIMLVVILTAVVFAAAGAAIMFFQDSKR
jgi:hypothetical protein